MGEIALGLAAGIGLGLVAALAAVGVLAYRVGVWKTRTYVQTLATRQAAAAVEAATAPPLSGPELGAALGLPPGLPGEPDVLPGDVKG